MKNAYRLAAAAVVAGLVAGTASAELRIGVSLPLSGPAAALGTASKNGISLWPSTIAGEQVKLIILDDATNPAQATKNAQRFVDEDKVDLILGSTATPCAESIADVAAASKTVQLASAPVVLPEGKGGWTFRLPQSTAVMASGVVRHMKDQDVKTFAFLGYSDGYGEGWLSEMKSYAKGFGLKLTAVERFGRADTELSAQAKKVIATNPDAIMIVASGGGASIPHKALIAQGYKGKIYQAHSAASRELLRLGGKDVEGAYVVAGLAVFPEALPDFHPSKKMAVEFVNKYEQQFGAGTRNQFAGHLYDAHIILEKVVTQAKKKAQPGTPEFRAALKDELEKSGNIVLTQGVVRYLPTDHFGMGALSRMMLKIEDGGWRAEPFR